MSRRDWYALDRTEDVSGISGTGRVAYALPVLGAGVILLWDTTFMDEDGIGIERPSHGVEWLPDLSMLRIIHCYQGKTALTRLEQVDEAAIARAEELLAYAAPRLDTLLLVLSRERKGALS